jgi:GT2 family glycosyltransferase
VTVLPASLRVSVVVWHPDFAVLENTLRSLMRAAGQAQAEAVLADWSVILVDNGSQQADLQALLARLGLTAQLLCGHGNVGYGRGHNMALAKQALTGPASTDLHNNFHLVLNPDVSLQPDTLVQGLRYLAAHPAAVAVAPAITDAAGQQEPACRRNPSVFDFLLRGFAPAALRRRFSRRLARYEMRDLPDDRATADVPIISGCFMLFRQCVLQNLGGFDPRYFLYFEDYDLSLRARAHGTLDYLPAMRITHLGGNAAGKGLRHVAMFMRSALRFFNSHGWRWT